MKNLAFYILFLFLGQNASANEIDFELISRTAFGRAADVELLLGNGANPNALNSADTPAIIIAASRTDDEAAKIVRLLVENGANFNLRDIKGDDAIIAAITSGTAESLEVLLSYNPAMRRLNAQNQSVLQLANLRGEAEIINLVQAAYNAEQERIKFFTSDENFRKFIISFSKSSCGEAYWQYYIRLDDEKKFEESFYEDQLASNTNARKKAGSNLKTFFSLSSRELSSIAEKSMRTTITEISSFAREFERRAAKIGTLEDYEDRCTRIGKNLSRTIKRKARSR